MWWVEGGGLQKGRQGFREGKGEAKSSGSNSAWG